MKTTAEMLIEILESFFEAATMILVVAVLPLTIAAAAAVFLFEAIFISHQRATETAREILEGNDHAVRR
jgi:hypothetical protein